MAREGLLVLTSGGQVDFAATDARRAASADPSKDHARRKGSDLGAARAEPEPAPAEIASFPEPGAATPSGLARARIANAVLDAKRKQIELDRLSGALAPVEFMKADIFKVFRMLGDKLGAAPAKIAPELAEIDDPGVIRALLKAEHDRILADCVASIERAEWWT